MEPHRHGAAPEYPRAREWLRANEPFRRDVLARLCDAGPLTSRDVPDTSLVPWRFEVRR